MNRDEEAEASRPRPLSGGIWTLFSWLRRSDRSSCSESVSSVGSDRTAASFDFLSPIHYRLSAPPILLSPKSPTDSYKKRVHERNLRRQRERDLTLHRKYGLWREDGTGYDAFSLPSASKISELGNKQARCRRAASECLQRRAAYVPGKRQAPLPPTIKSTSLPRNYKRKRPAPKPPAERVEANKENIEINNNHLPSSFHSSLKIYELKSDSLKQDKQNKDVKLRSEKSFIKQIFESKRNSAIKISPNKLLPSISELDKQAAEIIETNRMIRNFENNNSIKGQILTSGNMWTCTKCLRRYNKTIKSCVYCIPKLDTAHGTNIYTQTELHGQNDVKINSKTVDDIEKKKLKEMLKEMKDSLPKKKKEIKFNTNTERKETNSSTEFPTLRIGSTLKHIENQQSQSNQIQVRKQSNILDSTNIIKVPFTRDKNDKVEATTSNQTPKQLFFNTKSLESKTPNEIAVKSPSNKIEQDEAQTKLNNVTSVIEVQEINKNQIKQTLQGIKDPQTSNTMDIQQNPMNIGKNVSIHTPLKISSLLNPIYLPKNTNEILVGSSTSNMDKDVLVNDSDTKVQINPASSKFSPVNKCRLEPEIVSQIIKKSIEEKQKKLLQRDEKKESKAPVASNIGHSERMDLINQLELSIAKGDEKAAAEAAVKLAKLRLSCSVLSLSSQIIGQPSTSNACADYGNKLNVKPQSNHNATPHTEGTTSSITSEKANREIVENKKCLNENKSCNNEKEINSLIIENPNQDKEELPKSNTATDDRVNVSIWIEDKIAARGPIELNISRRATIVDLRQEAENSFGLAIRLQRWIIGKTLCTDDSVPIVSLAGSDFTAPFYLCLVESGDANGNTEAAKQDTISEKSVSGEFYTELIKLEQQALVTNSEHFECGVCMEDCAAGNGAVLRECIHTFCRECLSDVVRHCEEPVVPCPAIGCPGALQDREIRALLTAEDYEKWLARGLAAAENGTRNTFHCRTTDCSGWAFCEPGVRRFPCPVCKHTNCVPCQAVHEGYTCEQYQRKLRETVAAVETNSDEGTQALLNSLIARGEALECPECRSIITKKWGCDWVKCSACKTEICWITKGRRWGPGGRGDTSGGCRCGIDGKRCHPSCGYCH